MDRIRGGGRVLAAGAAGTLLMVAASAPATADDRAGTDRTAEHAVAVEGAASSADAPLIEAGGVYSDAIGPDETLYYALALDDVSSAYFTTVAAPAPGGEVLKNDGFEVELLTSGNASCGVNSADFGTDRAARPVSTWVTRSPETADPACRRAGDYLLTLTRTSYGDPAPWPVEIGFVQEPPVERIQPTPDPQEWAEELPAMPTGQGTPVSGGSGFDDARAIGEGVWRDDIGAGQSLVFRVPVDWGQQLAVSTELANAPGASGSYATYGVRTELFSPLRVRNGYQGFDRYAGDQFSHGQVGPRVAYGNRAITDNAHASRTRFAGWQYVMVTLHPDVASVTTEPVALTLRVALIGEREAGPPYDGDLAAAGLGVTDRDIDQANRALSDADLAAESSGAQRLLGAAGIGLGVLLLAFLGGWRLRDLRRTAGRAAGRYT
ncbi:hypothetical protein ACWGIB_10935 [Streptomyces xiamenensis]